MMPDKHIVAFDGLRARPGIMPGAGYLLERMIRFFADTRAIS